MLATKVESRTTHDNVFNALPGGVVNFTAEAIKATSPLLWELTWQDFGTWRSFYWNVSKWKPRGKYADAERAALSKDFYGGWGFSPSAKGSHVSASWVWVSCEVRPLICLYLWRQRSALCSTLDITRSKVTDYHKTRPRFPLCWIERVSIQGKKRNQSTWLLPVNKQLCFPKHLLIVKYWSLSRFCWLFTDNNVVSATCIFDQDTYV